MATQSLQHWRLGKRAQKRLRRSLGLSRPVAYGLVRAATATSAPLETLRRRRAARRLAAETALVRPVPHGDGFRRVDVGELPGADVAVEASRKIFERLRRDNAQPKLRSNYPKQDFLVPMLQGEAAGENPELLRFALSPAVVQAAAVYLGTVPVLANVGLLWSPPNDSEHSSQKFHHDYEDTTQLKLFLHVSDVDPSCGPFTLIPAGPSRRIDKKIGYSGGRIDDATVAAAGGAEAVEVITGPSGSGVFVDTSRCLHFGSRGNRRERLMLLVHFLRFTAPSNYNPTRCATREAASALDLDAVQRMLLLE